MYKCFIFFNTKTKQDLKITEEDLKKNQNQDLKKNNKNQKTIKQNRIFKNAED